MASEIEICNMALSHLRAGSINSLTETSLQAQQCNLWYPIIRDRMLNESTWQFNRKIRALSVLTTEIFNWAYAYQYPTDCLKIARMVGAHEETRTQIPYEVFNFSENKVIGSNESELRIDYAAKITDPNLFSVDFRMAFSYLLASVMAVPIVGAEIGRQLRGDSLNLYQSYLAAAIADDMNDQYSEPALSEFETIRR